MLVELKRLESNPLRDFKVDPVDDVRVEALTQSIKDDGFWGGVVCRRVNGTIQIAAGQHRIDAALKAGLKTADLFVADDMDDATLVRIYGRENATQRGNSGTAQAGSVAAAIRFIAKGLATGHLAGIPARSQKAVDVARGTMVSGDGIGHALIETVLADTGITHDAIKEQLANLKSSGAYARIIDEVKDEIERENQEALKELARQEKAQKAAEETSRKAEEARKAAVAHAKAARDEADKQRAKLAQERAEVEARLAKKRQDEMDAKMKEFAALKQTRDTITNAAEKASGRKVTFHADVDKILTVPSHASEFRRLVELPGVQPYVTVAQQPALARNLVAEAKAQKVELTSRFLHDNIGTLARYGRGEQRKKTNNDREARDREMIVSKYRRLIDELGTAFRSMTRISGELADLERTWPRGVAKPFYGTYIEDLRIATKVMQQLNRRVGNE